MSRPKRFACNFVLGAIITFVVYSALTVRAYPIEYVTVLWCVLCLYEVNRHGD